MRRIMFRIMGYPIAVVMMPRSRAIERMFPSLSGQAALSMITFRFISGISPQ